jgi:hypothetical protein
MTTCTRVTINSKIVKVMQILTNLRKISLFCFSRLRRTTSGFYSFDFYLNNFDKLKKSPKFRHASEGKHPELFENPGFAPSRE